MKLIKTLISNKFLWVVLLLPLIIQILFFIIVTPAINSADENIYDMKVAIVNKDSQTGTTVTKMLKKNLPFKTVEYKDRDNALDKMNDGDVSAVFYIPKSFTSDILAGKAEIKYYINQASSSLNKQIMESVAKQINGQINKVVFDKQIESMKSGFSTLLSSGALPPAAVNVISGKLNGALSSVKYESVTGKIIKVNNQGGLTQSFISMFIYIIYFITSIIFVIILDVAFKKIKADYSNISILLAKTSVILISSAITPFAFMIISKCFDIQLDVSYASLWWLLFVGFITFALFIQMFFSIFGMKGMGPTVLIFFPLQLVTCSLILPKEILPSFYLWIRDFLPSTYFGSGLMHAIYGGVSINSDISLLLLSSLIFIVIILAVDIIKWHKPQIKQELN